MVMIYSYKRLVFFFLELKRKNFMNRDFDKRLLVEKKKKKWSYLSMIRVFNWKLWIILYDTFYIQYFISIRNCTYVTKTSNRK